MSTSYGFHMITKGQKRKNRCISASDSEWRVVSEMGDRAGMKISHFVLQKVLIPPTSDIHIEQVLLPEPAPDLHRAIHAQDAVMRLFETH